MKRIKLFGKEWHILSEEEKKELGQLINDMSVEGQAACLDHRVDIKARDKRPGEVNAMLDDLYTEKATEKQKHINEMWKRACKILID